MRVIAAQTRLDAALVALADPTRRAILQRLAQGEATVTEIAAPFAVSLNAVSKHIRLLERGGLVQRRRAGREHILSFDAAPLHDVAAWIHSQSEFWTRRLDALDAMLKAEDAVPSKAARRKGSLR